MYKDITLSNYILDILLDKYTLYGNLTVDLFLEEYDKNNI